MSVPVSVMGVALKIMNGVQATEPAQVASAVVVPETFPSASVCNTFVTIEGSQREPMVAFVVVELSNCEVEEAKMPTRPQIGVEVALVPVAKLFSGVKEYAAPPLAEPVSVIAVAEKTVNGVQETVPVHDTRFVVVPDAFG